jgi:hypothetical protein
MNTRYEHDRETLTDPGSIPLDSRPKSRKPVFDPTINLGHVLTFLGFLAVGGGAYLNIEKRVTVQEVRSEMSERDIESEKQRTGTALTEIKNDIKEVRRGIDELRSTPRKP